MRGVLAFIATLLVTLAAPAAELPTLSARVTDLTGTLHAQQVANLEQKLAALEQRKGSQVVVAVVPTTQPDTIEQYAVTLFEKNEIGRKGVDDGVLLVVAKDDRKVRIEVGYGLEGAIPDAYANRIIAEYLTPKFRTGDFYGGIDEATTAIAKLVEGEALPEPMHSAPSRDEPLMPGVLIIAFWCTVAAAVVLRRAQYGLRALAAAVLSGVGAKVLFGSVAAIVIASVAAFFLSMFIGARGGGRYTGGSSGGGWGGGDWGGGGGSSGGGWSGGGGRSGGGGASGSW